MPTHANPTTLVAAALLLISLAASGSAADDMIWHIKAVPIRRVACWT